MEKGRVHLIGFSVVTLALFVAGGYGVWHSFDNWTERGQFGDMFGAVNALFSTVTLIAVYTALLLQQRQLKVQFDEMQDAKFEASRPIITAFVRGAGNAEAALKTLHIFVENTGNRPAINIQLSVDEATLISVLTDKPHDVLRDEISFIFSSRGIIPLLANGKETSNGFGRVAKNNPDSTWKWNSILPVMLKYEDIQGKKYEHNIQLRISDNTHFAGGGWSQPKTVESINSIM